MANVKGVTGEQFEEEVLKNDKPVVVDFYATWCGPCQALAPVVDEIAGQFDGQLDVVKVNIDEEPGLAERYGVMSIPTLVFFAAGQEFHRVTGALPRKAFAGLVRELLEAPQGKV